jgi:hypothetical protein
MLVIRLVFEVYYMVWVYYSPVSYLSILPQLPPCMRAHALSFMIFHFMPSLSLSLLALSLNLLISISLDHLASFLHVIILSLPSSLHVMVFHVVVP